MSANPGFTLVGQFDSPYVRRVAISMEQLGFGFEQRPWSVGRDQALLRTINPLGRVPVLLLASGESLIESSMILDYLDEQAGAQRRLLPAAGAPRRAVQSWLALATGALDKGAQPVYERIFRPVEKHHEPWLQRCREQATGALVELDRRCGERAGADWLVGDAMTQADVSLACFMTYLSEAMPFDLRTTPALKARIERLEALPLFAKYYVPFDAPVPSGAPA